MTTLGSVKNILVINLGGIGDCLLSTPALNNLKGAYPAAHITLFVLSRSQEILEGTSFADEIISIGSLKDWFDVYRILAALRNKKIDIAINMRTLASFWGAMKMAAMLFIINPRVKAGRDTDGLGFFLDVKLPETHIGTKHDMDYCIELVKLVGASETVKRPEVNLTVADNARVDTLLRDHGLSDNDIIIGISSGAPYPAKRWPLENFVKVASTLAGYNYKVVIMGDGSEAGSERAFIGLDRPGVISLIGKMRIKEMAALIKRCAVHITNDIGPMHIAATLGTPVVAIFGPGHLTRFDPRRISDNAIVLHKETACAPCEREECASRKCLTAITPEEVIAAVLELLKRRGR